MKSGNEQNYIKTVVIYSNTLIQWSHIHTETPKTNSRIIPHTIEMLRKYLNNLTRYNLFIFFAHIHLYTLVTLNGTNKFTEEVVIQMIALKTKRLFALGLFRLHSITGSNLKKMVHNFPIFFSLSFSSFVSVCCCLDSFNLYFLTEID